MTIFLLLEQPWMNRIKKYETIACCGIDCGLCPRYYTKGDSKCPGCGGTDFYARRGTCGHFTCCAVRKGLEVCAECTEYPCRRLDPHKAGCDSFVTHQKMLSNLKEIKANGLEQFLEKQRKRMDILSYLLDNHDNGRAKSFYCISCTLLPIEKLEQIKQKAENLSDTLALKERCTIIRNALTEAADSMHIELKLNRSGIKE